MFSTEDIKLLIEEIQSSYVVPFWICKKMESKFDDEIIFLQGEKICASKISYAFETYPKKSFINAISNHEYCIIIKCEQIKELEKKNNRHPILTIATLKMEYFKYNIANSYKENTGVVCNSEKVITYYLAFLKKDNMF